MNRRHDALLLLIIAFFVGCGSGGGDYAYEIENPDPPETVYANEAYQMILEMDRANKAEGPDAVDVYGYLEGVAMVEEPAVGEHGGTYEELHAGVKELQQMLESGASQGDVQGKIDELMEKAETLPHSSGEAEGGGE